MPPSSYLFACWASLVIGVAGCGGGNGNSSAQQLCNQSAAAMCEKASTCGGASALADMGYASVADCTKQSQAEDCANPTCPTGQTYHADQAQKCIDETKAQSCVDFTNGDPPVSCLLICSAAGVPPASGGSGGDTGGSGGTDEGTGGARGQSGGGGVVGGSTSSSSVGGAAGGQIGTTRDASAAGGAGDANTASSTDTDMDGAACDGSAMAGTWYRASDGLVMILEAKGCAITGTCDTSYYRHIIEGTYDDVTHTMIGTIRRTAVSNGCVTLMQTTWALTDPQHFTMTIIGTDGLCNLATTYTEVSTFARQ